MGYYNYRVTGACARRCRISHTTRSTPCGPLGCGRPRRGPTPAIQQSGAEEFLAGSVWRGRPGFTRSFAEGARVRSAGARSILPGLARSCCTMLVGAVPLWRNPTARRVLLLGALFYAGCAMDARLSPHYAAPATALIYSAGGLGIARCVAACARVVRRTQILAAGVAALFVVVTRLALFTPLNRYLLQRHRLSRQSEARRYRGAVAA